MRIAELGYSMSEYVVGVCTTVDVDSGEEINKYYIVYLKEPSGIAWAEGDCDTLEEARKLADELEERDKA